MRSLTVLPRLMGDIVAQRKAGRPLQHYKSQAARRHHLLTRTSASRLTILGVDHARGQRPVDRFLFGTFFGSQLFVWMSWMPCFCNQSRNFLGLLNAGGTALR